MSVNGGRSVNNNFTFNGANFTHFGQTTGVNMPPPDAVQEIRIQTSNFTAEYGNNSGSQVSVTSKAGTNQFHGSLWEFLRNDKLNARSFFQTRRAQTRQNQFGGAGGGPIKKDQSVRLRLLPAPGEPAGDGIDRRRRFLPRRSAAAISPASPPSGIRPIRITGQPMLDLTGRPCIAGNIVSPSCISPAAKKILDQYVPVTANNIFVSFNPQPSSNYSYMGARRLPSKQQAQPVRPLLSRLILADEQHRLHQQVHGQDTASTPPITRSRAPTRSADPDSTR